MTAPTDPRSSASSSVYWAAETDLKKFGNAVYGKVSDSYTWGRTSQILYRLERAYLYYFGLLWGGVHATSEVLREGDQGELAAVRVNHSRALCQTLLNLIGASKITWQPVATNGDYSADSQAELAQGVLEYYWSDGRVSQYTQRALEESIPFTESFLLTEWDDTLGEDHLGDETAPNGIMKTGDIRFTNVMTWDVIRDPRKRSYEDLDWVIVRVRRNKYDIAARWAATDPELAERIKRMQPNLEMMRENRFYELIPLESDDVDFFYFFHKDTAACPGGRESFFLDSDIVLKDGPLSTDFWPLHRVFHSELVGTPFAYSPYLEILGLQEMVDSLETSFASNYSTFATQSIIMEEGAKYDVDFLAGGMKALYKPSGSEDPHALQLVSVPQGGFQYLDSKKKDMEQLMGLNAVVRGEPLTGDQSGAALALLQAQAVQQSSGLQTNYLRFVQSVGNAVLELIRTKCPLPRRIAITGKANAFLQKEQTFTGSDIGHIRQVMVEIGNPMAQTAAGRVSMAKELMANHLIKTPEQYLQVIATGRLEPMTSSIQNELLLITKENEMMLAGQQPIASIDDDHRLHAREHRGLMANPDARMDPKIMQAYMAHIEEHEQLFFQADPRRLALMGQEPPPPIGMPGMPPPGPGGPPPPQGPPPPGPQGQPPSGAKLPQMPVNPATGQQVMPPDGALGQAGAPPNPGHPHGAPPPPHHP